MKARVVVAVVVVNDGMNEKACADGGIGVKTKGVN